MNTFWLKIVSGVIGLLIIIVLVSMFMPSGEPESVQQPNESNSPPITTFADQTKKDSDNFSVPGGTPINQDTSPVTPQPNEANGISPKPAAVQPVSEAPKSTQIKIFVKELGESEKIEAEQELNYAIPMRSIGRLPVTSYKPAIDSARRIINRWPDSVYAYQAKRMLASLPERYQQQYSITPQEMDISNFSKPRTGTMPYILPIEE